MMSVVHCRCGCKATERQSLLQQLHNERAKHKAERLKLVYQVDALMGQVNELEEELYAERQRTMGSEDAPSS